MNIANKLTLFRILLVPVFLIFMYIDIPYGEFIAGVIFTIAAITDMLDGYLARSRNLVTTFGKFVDPLADKVLTCAAFIVLVEKHIFPAWAVIIIIAREFIITGFRTLAASNNITIAASKLGKLKTISQLIGLIWVLFSPPLPLSVGIVIFYIAVFLTALSGVDYIVKNIKILDLDNI